MVRIVRNVHNDRHSARHPEASQNAYHCERCAQSELSVIQNHNEPFTAKRTDKEEKFIYKRM